jgi:uncharacterized membrane protein YkoI
MILSLSTVTGLLLAGALLLTGGLGAAQAAGAADANAHRRCFSPEERRAAIASRKVVPLAKAIRAVKTKANGEVLRASLCEQGSDLVYVLTVLGRSGKVTRVTVDAANGTMMGGR